MEKVPFPVKEYPNDRENKYITFNECTAAQPGEKCCLTINDIICAFNRFYRFFHTWSKIISIATLVGWILYLIFGYADNLSQQNIAVENFARSGNQGLPMMSFNPHFEIAAFAILVLILGLFLSYVSAAIGKYFELKK